MVQLFKSMSNYYCGTPPPPPTVFFWGKTLNFWIYPTTHVLPKLFKKSILSPEIQFSYIFFTRHKVVPFSFFFFHISINNLILQKTWGYSI